MRRQLLAVAIVAAALPPPAVATLGAGVGAAPVALATPAAPGRAYTLPGLYVVNTGTSTSRYHVVIERLSPGREMTLPAGWVTTGRDGFLLRPHRAATVPVVVKVPAGAGAGRYLSDLVAATTTAKRANGTGVGAAAATKLELTVTAPGRGLPWGTVVAVAGALALLATAIVRVKRSGVRLRLERPARRF